MEIHAKGFAEKEEAVNLADTEAAKIKFELEPGGVLFGTVRDEAGKPLKGAGISVFPPNFSGPQIEYLTTDAEGRYRFEFLPVERGLQLSVSKDGFLDTRDKDSVQVSATAERELNFVLKRRPDGGSVRGTVTDADGKPVAGAKLSNSGRSSRNVRTATTNALGQFSMDDVFEGSGGHVLIVKAKGFAPQQITFTPGAKESPAEVRVKLEAGHRIHGQVVNEYGKPIGRVRIYYSDGNHGFDNIGGSADADANGKFEIDSLPAGAPFSFNAKGYSEIENAELQLDGADEVIVTMKSEGVIKGRVVNAATGKPVSPFSVQITFSPDRKAGDLGHHLSGARATSPAGERFANADGTFALKELIQGMPLQVTVSAEGYERQIERRVLAKSMDDMEQVEFRLPALNPKTVFTIRGRVVDEQGRPIAGAELRMISVNENPLQRRGQFIEYPFGWQMIRSDNVAKHASVNQALEAKSGADGTFTFKEVRPAAGAEIVYWGEGISQGRLDDIGKFSVEELGKLTIKGVTPGTIRGTIDRKAVPGVTDLELNWMNGGIDHDYRFAGLTADDTTFDFRNVPPGDYQVVVQGEHIPTDQTGGFTMKALRRYPVKVVSGETVTLDIKAAEEEK